MPNSPAAQLRALVPALSELEEGIISITINRLRGPVPCAIGIQCLTDTDAIAVAMSFHTAPHWVGNGSSRWLSADAAIDEISVWIIGPPHPTSEVEADARVVAEIP